MSIVAVIQARVGSTRLPGKVLKKIEGVTVLDHVISRVKMAKSIDYAVVATTINEEDKQLKDIAFNHSVGFFQGAENDVLDRFYKSVHSYEPDAIVRITADCPLIDPIIIDKVIDLYEKSNADYATNTFPPTFPDGLDVEIMSYDALSEAWNEAKLSSEREHVTPFIRKQKDRYVMVNLVNDTDLSSKRWTLDEPKDLEFIRAVFSGLYNKNEIFLMKDILDYLQNNPDIDKINQDIARNEGYLKSLRGDYKVEGKNGKITGSL